jgi:glycosyltransferase involved in cell wall biosynthesis
MKLLFVVQRYGVEVAGGAESACRQFAERLVSRGHDVEVVTSAAKSYVDWANVYRPGVVEIAGVRVHRLHVRRARDQYLFHPMNARVVFGQKPVSPFMQRRWMQAQGPELVGLERFLRDRAEGFDAVAFFTYLYDPAWRGVPIAGALAPTVLHPTAHDEPPFYLPLFDREFRHATSLALFTPEEGELIQRRFGIAHPSAVVGIGIDLPDRPGKPDRFRSTFGLGDRPYVLFLGRVDPGKGSDEIERFFRAYKERNPGDLALVVMGEAVTTPEDSDDVVVTGFVDEEAKADALAGAVALVQPSYFESFSLALCEAWAHGTPALVQGYTDVLVGQARRSGGAIPYTGFGQFEAALQRLLDDEGLRRALGAAGRLHVEREYRWDVVLERYEALIDTTRAAWTPPGDGGISRARGLGMVRR